MKKDKEGEEKGKWRGFFSILGFLWRLSCYDNSVIGRVMEL